MDATKTPITLTIFSNISKQKQWWRGGGETERGSTGIGFYLSYVWGLAFSGANYYCAVVVMCRDGALWVIALHKYFHQLLIGPFQI